MLKEHGDYIMIYIMKNNYIMMEIIAKSLLYLLTYVHHQHTIILIIKANNITKTNIFHCLPSNLCIK